MPLWPHEHVDVEALAAAAHTQWVQQRGAIATAPATCPLLGELTDHAGGVVLIALGHQRVAVARSPRTDETMRVRVITVDAEGHTVDAQESTASLDELRGTYGEQQEYNTANFAQRLAIVQLTMMHRQLITRDTPGMDVTVVNTIPEHAGLGAAEALDTAFALTLSHEPEEHQKGPARTKLAEVCAQACATFTGAAASRARYMVALRGREQALNVVDFADHSITQVAHPEDFGYRLLVVCPPRVASPNIQRAMARFIDDVTGAFAAPSLRLLPNARERVLSWLRAVHQVHPDTQAPTVNEAETWLRYLEDEIRRAEHTTNAIRSRRSAEMLPAMNSSHQQYAALVELADAVDATASLCLNRGAGAARAVDGAVLCLLPRAEAEQVAQSLAADGLHVVAVDYGAAGDVEKQAKGE